MIRDEYQPLRSIGMNRREVAFLVAGLAAGVAATVFAHSADEAPQPASAVHARESLEGPKSGGAR